MNTGILLKKPGESDYSRYRRFLVSNHGNYTSLSTIKQDLISKLLFTDAHYEASDAEQLETQVLAQLFENEYIEKYSLKTKVGKIGYTGSRRLRKHCPKCADACYHSELFNFKEVTHCPLHLTELITECHHCNKQWPTPSQLLGRKCKSCGVKVNMKDLINRRISSESEDYSIIDKAEKLLKFNCSKYPKHYSIYRQWPIHDASNYINCLDKFYASVLINEKNNSSIDKSILKDCGVVLYDVHEVKCIIREAYPNIKDYSQTTEIKLSVLNDIKIKIMKYLDMHKKRHHAIGDCSHMHFHDTCVCCITWELWSYLNRNEHSKSNEGIFEDVLTRKTVELRYFLKKICEWSILCAPSVPLYIKHNEYSSHDTYSTYYRIPKNVQKQLFSIDLWTTFLCLFACVEFVKARSEKETWEAEAISKLASLRNSLFCPYYIKKCDFKTNELIISFPKILFEKKHKKAEFYELFAS